MTVEVSRVLEADLADRGGRQVLELLPDEGLGVGPGTVVVGIVGFDHHPVFADDVEQAERGRVLDRREPEVLVHDVLGVGSVACQ